jgi:MGT family glycosyltransferase
MRVLFTCLPQSGHFHPLVPIARALRDAGHEVAFACPAGFAPTVEAAGFTAFPAGFEERGQPIPALFPGSTRQSGAERAIWVTAQLFVGVYAAAMAANLLGVCRAWPPDLIVRDGGEFGGCVAAEALGLPHASVRTGALSGSYTLRRRYRTVLAPLRERAGLAPDPDDAMAFRYLHLAAEPPGFAPPGEGHAPTTHFLRPENFESGDGALPPWVAGLPDRPTVYATLGTVHNAQPHGRATFSAILEAVRDEPWNVILTVGRDNDPAAFGPQPEHVHIARYIRQSQLLPHCDLVVNQGGFSTLTGALNAGLPLVVIPLGADQPLNAACCTALGVGRVIEPGAQTAESIRAAVRAVLADPTFRRNAERVRDETAALPGPEYAVALLERLALERQPIMAAG